MYWEIEPHEDGDYDVCVMLGDSEDDHRLALEYATARLESLFDTLEEGDKATVTIKCCKGTIPEGGKE
jgi:hypothetical protein